jgi:hypothetical protein
MLHIGNNARASSDIITMPGIPVIYINEEIKIRKECC